MRPNSFLLSSLTGTWPLLKLTCNYGSFCSDVSLLRQFIGDILGEALDGGLPEFLTQVVGWLRRAVHARNELLGSPANPPLLHAECDVCLADFDQVASPRFFSVGTRCA